MKKLLCHISIFSIALFSNSSLTFAAENSKDILRQAKVYAEAGRYKDAVALLKTFEAQERSEELAINLIAGKIYLEIEKPVNALEFFEAANDQDIENFEAAIGAANASIKLGQFKQARQFVKSAKDAYGDSAEPTLLEALIALRTGKSQEANAMMANLSKTRPDSADVAVAYAKYLKMSGDTVAAIRNLQNFADKNPLAGEPKELLGEYEFQFGSKINGIKQKKNALRLYDQQGKSFQRDVIAAWLETNEPKPEPSKPSSPQVKEPVKKIEELPKTKPTPDNPPTAQNDKTIKQARAKSLPSKGDQEFTPPLQRFPFPEGVGISGGSGFIVDAGKKVVTNRHVIDGGKEFAVRTGLGEVIRAKVVFISSTDDLAVLELEKPLPANRAIPSTSYSKPRVGRNVLVMGYPLWHMLGVDSPSLTNGMVSKRTGLRDDLGTFQLTAKVNKGNSGGPVFDFAGNIVGITVGKLDTKRMQDEQGVTPEDVNFAIHVDRLPKNINIVIDGKDTSDSDLSTEELYQLMLGKVVMVATYK
jgi:serine protease Do